MTKKQIKNLEFIINIVIGAIAILAVKSIFEDDSSKIVSKKGRKILSDAEKMDLINKKIQDSEDQKQYSEIYI